MGFRLATAVNRTTGKHADVFALIVRVTDRKIDPEHTMAMLAPEDVEAARADEEEILERESPFE